MAGSTALSPVILRHNYTRLALVTVRGALAAAQIEKLRFLVYRTVTRGRCFDVHSAISDGWGEVDDVSNFLSSSATSRPCLIRFLLAFLHRSGESLFITGPLQRRVLFR